MSSLAPPASVIPMGVSSPLRACRNVDSPALQIVEARGTELVDVDGRRYLDFMYGFGPLILGHADPDVVAAICAQAARGTLYATGCPLEERLARLICGSAEHLERLRFVCSGTEASMSALRVARAFTRRTRIVRMYGHFHGHFDLAQGRFGAEALAAGLAPGAQADNVLVHYNRIDELARVLAGDEGVAAVILEPIACNMSLVEPEPGYLQAVRELCDRHGALLIFDETITAFRLGWGPASNLLGVQPDLTCMGKVIGGGTPVGAYGGRAEVMALLESEQVLQGGTFAANPLTMAAGLATLEKLARAETYPRLEALGALLEAEMSLALEGLGVDVQLARRGSIFALIFVPPGTPIRDKQDISRQDRDAYTHLYKALRADGIHLTPDVEEPLYLSLANSEPDVHRLVKSTARALASYQRASPC